MRLWLSSGWSWSSRLAQQPCAAPALLFSRSGYSFPPVAVFCFLRCGHSPLPPTPPDLPGASRTWLWLSYSLSWTPRLACQPCATSRCCFPVPPSHSSSRFEGKCLGLASSTPLRASGILSAAAFALLTVGFPSYCCSAIRGFGVPVPAFEQEWYFCYAFCYELACRCEYPRCEALLTSPPPLPSVVLPRPFSLFCDFRCCPFSVRPFPPVALSDVLIRDVVRDSLPRLFTSTLPLPAFLRPAPLSSLPNPAPAARPPSATFLAAIPMFCYEVVSGTRCRSRCH